MIISKLTNSKIAYYCLQVEAAYINSENNVHISGDATLLPKSAIDRVCDDIMNDTQNSTFVLDFDGIETIQVNAIEERISDLCKEHKKAVVLANIKESLVKQVKSFGYIVDAKGKIKSKKVPNLYSYYSFCNMDYKLLSDCETVFKAAFTEKLKEYKHDKKIKHYSSSVYLSAYINIKQFIIQDKPLVLYSIYRLARKMRIKKEWKNSFESKDKPILICQSLNGSYIASVLSSLLGLDLFVIDGIGPVNKLYRSLGATIKTGKKYIIVSDMVCLGTEVKITKNIIEYLGGVYFGNVSIVRIESIKTYDNVESVFCIDKSNNDKFQYQIITPLEK